MDIGSRGRVCPAIFFRNDEVLACPVWRALRHRRSGRANTYSPSHAALRPAQPANRGIPPLGVSQVWGGGGIQTPGCVVIVYEDTSSWEDGLGRLPAMKRAPEFCNAPCPESRLPAQRVEPQKSRSSVQREQSNARVSARYDQSSSSLPRSRSPAAVSRCANTARYSPPQGHQELPCQTSMRCCRRRDTHDSNHPPSATRRCRGRFSAC